MRATLDFNELKAKNQFLIYFLVKLISNSSSEFCLDNLHVMLSNSATWVLCFDFEGVKFGVT